MIDKKAKILVAVSGGVDSVYMLHYLVKQGYTNLGVAHVNHNLREESQEEFGFVWNLALTIADDPLLCHSTSIHIKEIAEERNQSIELTAREDRRDYFKAIMINHEYEWLALGHHVNDQAETVLFNLLRGSGVHGLAGMLAEDRKQNIFRPLLHMTKEQIYENATQANLEWREDHTNQESEHDRNWLRNVIIPQLEERRAGTTTVLYDTALRMQDMSDYIKQKSEKWVIGLFIHNNDRLLVSDFMYEHKVLRAEILGLIWCRVHGSRKNFSNKVVFEVEKWLSSNPEGNSRIYFGKEKELVYRKNLAQRSNMPKVDMVEIVDDESW